MAYKFNLIKMLKFYYYYFNKIIVITKVLLKQKIIYLDFENLTFYFMTIKNINKITNTKR